jgi:hypothetical protein
MQKRYKCHYGFTSHTDFNLQNQKQGFRSEVILNVYAIHLKKVARAAAIYGEQFGALVLCTATVRVYSLSYLNMLSTSPFTRPSAHCYVPCLSLGCAPTYASPILPPSLSVPTGPLCHLYRTNFGRCRDLDA